MQIKNCVALVTGASGGLGRCLVGALLQSGARRVYAASRRLDEDALIVDADPRVTVLSMDVTDRAAVRATARIAHDVTLLVNNAGAMSSRTVERAEVAAVRLEFETNVFAALNTVQAFSGVIARNGGGAILNILSVSALAASANVAGYSASKAAAHSLTQSMRAELGRKGIAVFGAYPGPVDTRMAISVTAFKADPKQVAAAVLHAVEAGIEDIFPDAMALQAEAVWARSPKKLEALIASLSGPEKRQGEMRPLHGSDGRPFGASTGVL